MIKPLLLSTITATFLVSNLFGATEHYIPNLNEELNYNIKKINQYKKIIEEFEQRNIHLKTIKAKNPNLYVEKKLYEDTNSTYIYRIKLDGAEAKNLNFTISNHMASIEMYLKIERNDSNGYYASSKNFYQHFPIPKDVEESKIENKIDGDYFEIIMPKKKP